MRLLMSLLITGLPTAKLAAPAAARKAGRICAVRFGFVWISLGFELGVGVWGPTVFFCAAEGRALGVGRVTECCVSGQYFRLLDDLIPHALKYTLIVCSVGKQRHSLHATYYATRQPD